MMQTHSQMPMIMVPFTVNAWSFDSKQILLYHITHWKKKLSALTTINKVRNWIIDRVQPLKFGKQLVNLISHFIVQVIS